MSALHVVDEKGARISVALDIRDYHHLPEELECLRAYDAAKASEEKAIPFEEAVAEIECQRR